MLDDALELVTGFYGFDAARRAAVRYFAPVFFRIDQYLGPRERRACLWVQLGTSRQNRCSIGSNRSRRPEGGEEFY